MYCNSADRTGGIAPEHSGPVLPHAVFLSCSETYATTQSNAASSWPQWLASPDADENSLWAIPLTVEACISTLEAMVKAVWKQRDRAVNLQTSPLLISFHMTWQLLVLQLNFFAIHAQIDTACAERIWPSSVLLAITQMRQTHKAAALRVTGRHTPHHQGEKRLGSGTLPAIAWDTRLAVAFINWIIEDNATCGDPKHAQRFSEPVTVRSLQRWCSSQIVQPAAEAAGFHLHQQKISSWNRGVRTCVQRCFQEALKSSGNAEVAFTCSHNIDPISAWVGMDTCARNIAFLYCSAQHGLDALQPQYPKECRQCDWAGWSMPSSSPVQSVQLAVANMTVSACLLPLLVWSGRENMKKIPTQLTKRKRSTSLAHVSVVQAKARTKKKQQLQRMEGDLLLNPRSTLRCMPAQESALLPKSGPRRFNLHACVDSVGTKQNASMPVIQMAYNSRGFVELHVVSGSACVVMDSTLIGHQSSLGGYESSGSEEL